MVPSRRDFLKLLGSGTGATLLLGTVGAAPAVAVSSDGLTQSRGKAMLYDALKCVGCRACQNACKDWNKLPAESLGYGEIYDNPLNLSAKTWTMIKAREYTNKGKPQVMFCRYQCMHCTEASCESVCPTGAISHQGAAVIIDQKVCIGCGYCVQACPFDVPHKEHGLLAGAARKCTFCVDRQAEGLSPACVESCPAGALYYGQRDTLIAQAKDRVAELNRGGYPNATFYGERELGGLHSLYILAERPSIYGLPEMPPEATSTSAFQWLSGVAAAGVLAALPLWYIFRRKNKEALPVTPVSDQSEGGN